MEEENTLNVGTEENAEVESTPVQPEEVVTPEETSVEPVGGESESVPSDESI